MSELPGFKDVLYIIAEKLLARIPDGQEIDFREQNCCTNFMSLNELANRTIIHQFAKFKRIAFMEYYGEETIKFYKNARFNDSQTAEFGGPYIVPKGMLEFLIENGKFRVNTIETNRFLSVDRSIDIQDLGEMNSLKAFCALFLGKQIQIPDGLNNNLMVKKFNMYNLSVESILEIILAIDAVELEIFNQKNIIIDCSQYKSPIIAQNTTKITVRCHFEFESSKEKLDKFVANFETFYSFLIRVCPALNNLQFHIGGIRGNSSIDEFTGNFYSMIKTMEAGIKSINIGNEHLQISIGLRTDFYTFNYDKLPIQSHDLFKLGSPFTLKINDYGNKIGRYIARSLECVDAHGRIHKLQFKIFEDIEESDEDDSMDTSDDDDEDEEEDGDDEDEEEDGDEDEDDEDENDEEEDGDDVEFDYDNENDEPY